MRMAKKREPRPPMLLSTLPATFAAAEEASIIEAVDGWYVRVADKLSSDAGYAAVRDDIYRQIGLGAAAALPLDYIISMAKIGHPPARDALDAYIDAVIDANRFDQLPVEVRAYDKHARRRQRAAGGYPSNVPQVVPDFTRDIGIGFLLDQIVLHWPHVPRLHSSRSRHSAAWLLAVVFDRHGVPGLSERQIRRIDAERQTLSRRLAEFLIGTIPNGEPPFGL
jgi:hypothetical protein